MGLIAAQQPPARTEPNHVCGLSHNPPNRASYHATIWAASGSFVASGALVRGDAVLTTAAADACRSASCTVTLGVWSCRHSICIWLGLRQLRGCFTRP